MPDKKQTFWAQISRFVLSAGVGFAVDLISFSIFLKYVFVQEKYEVFNYRANNYSLAVGVSFFLGVVVNFLMTRYIVFTESRTSFSKQFIRFSSVAIIGFFATQFILNFIVVHFGVPKVTARVTTAFTLFFASFFIHKVFSFSLSLRHQHAPADTSAGS